jgi:hypothetical protein
MLDSESDWEVKPRQPLKLQVYVVGVVRLGLPQLS